MPLAIEDVADAVLAYLYARFANALGTVRDRTDSTVPLPAPARENYFIGEPPRFVAYRAPAVFLISNRTRRPGEADTGHNTILYQQHELYLSLLVESTTTEQDLTRQCWRYAEAADLALRDADVFTATTERSSRVYVTNIDYGVLFLPEQPQQRIFRKDVWLDLRVDHWDRRTPYGLPPTGTALSEVKSTVLARAVDTLLTTTSATTVINSAPTGSGGNYLINLYYRVATATTAVTLAVAWADASGAQTITPVDGSAAVGAHSVTPIYFTATTAAAITVIATAGTANQVYVSASLEQL